MGSYLAEQLLEEGHEVLGVVRRSSTASLENLKGPLSHSRFTLLQGDVSDPISVNRLISETKPCWCVNLAAQSHVRTSFDQPSYTWAVDAMGPLYLLEAIRLHSPATRFYQASSSEMFGAAYSRRFVEKKGIYKSPWSQVCSSGDDLKNWVSDLEEVRFQNESTPFVPQSPYAIAKLAAHHQTRLYREAHGLFASCGILFNFESPRRPEEFVTRKISRWAASWVAAKRKGRVFLPRLTLGNLDAKRDWGYAPEYAKAIRLILSQAQPADFVIATGETHSVVEFLEAACAAAGIPEPLGWVDLKDALRRPNEVPYLRGCAQKAERELGWKPKVKFPELVRKMVEADIELSLKNS